MTHDPRAIIQAIRLIVAEGNVTELRALEGTIAGDRWPATYSGYFDDPEHLAKAVGTIKTAKGIYFVPNPADPALMARAFNRIRKAPKGESTQDSNILRRRWLLIDTDAQRPSGISATDAEREESIQRARSIFCYLKDQGWPDPIAADSGNGGHLLYPIDLPADDGGLVQRCLIALAERFDDDVVKVDQTVFNAARIWKLYGTMARKGDDTPERPHRMARILSKPDKLEPAPPGLIKALAAGAHEGEKGKNKSGYCGNDQAFDLEAFIARHELDVTGPEDWNGTLGRGRRWILNTDPMHGIHNDGSCYIIQHANGAISAGCHHNSATWAWADLRAKYEPRRQVKWLAGSAHKTPPRSAPFKPFPIDALPEPVRGFVNIGAKAIGCDPSFIALPLFAALASAIGNTRRIQLKTGWTEPAVLWTVIVGESGTLKSPAIDAPLRPIRKKQAQALKRHCEELAQYNAELEEHKAKLAEWRSKGRKVGKPQPTAPGPPVCKRFWCSDITVEALADRLLHATRGLLLVRDELSGWLRGFNQYKAGRGGDAAHWLEMHRAGHLMVDRKTGDRTTIHVPRAAVCLTGSIQPEILRVTLATEHFDDGMAARLLLAMPPRKVKRWTEHTITPELEVKLADLFDALLGLQPNIDGNGDSCPVIVPLARDGKVAWVEFFNAHAAEQIELAGDLAAAWSKLEGYAARLALVIHFIRWAADDPILADPDAIDAESVAAGVRLSRWFGHEARRVYAVLAESEDDRDRRRLVELIQRKGGAVTPRDLMRSSRLYSTAGEAGRALDVLAGAGYGQLESIQPGPRGGRPTKRFRLVDTADVDETPADVHATEGIVNVNGVDDASAEADRLIRQVERTDPDNAANLRDAWEERLAICAEDSGLSTATAVAVALDELRSLLAIRQW